MINEILQYYLLMGKTFRVCLLGLLAFSCQEKSQDSADVKSNEADSLLKQTVSKVFNKQGKYWDKEFEMYLDLNRKHLNKQIVIHPGQYKLTYFSFGDGQQYVPFAVRFTTLNDSLITHFSFGDEVYYMHNSNQAFWHHDTNEIEFDENSQPNNELTKLVNLDSNLNQLIELLDYKNDYQAIVNLIQILFNDVLGMEPVDIDQLKMIISGLDNMKSDDTRLTDCKKEYQALIDGYKNDGLCFQAKEGHFGYWTFIVEKDSGSYQVKTTFTGDLIYYQIYM